jgi:tetratricopeptide (TPR) repeat protein
MFYMAQQIAPKNPQAFVNLADSLMDRSLHEKAVWCLREAAALDPNMPGIHSRLAQGYAATGRNERARQLYLRELRNDPGDIPTLLDLGILLTDMNRLVEAGEKFRRVLELEPDNAEAHFCLADLAERSGQAESALEQFNLVLRLDAGYRGARRRIAALMLTRAGAEDEAAAARLLTQELDDVRKRLSRSSTAELIDLGQTLLDARMYAEAYEVLDEAAKRQPEDVRTLHLLSVSLLRLGRRAEGIEACRRVLKLDPKYVPAMHNVGVAFVLDGQWSKARYWVRQALLVDPDDATLRRLMFKLRLHRVAEVGGRLASPLKWLFLRRRRIAMT